MSSNDVSNKEEGTNVLSIDAGSLASVMSSIGVLEELMRRVQKVLNLPAAPNPCEHFDLMVGAGFAGLLVIMLGRLRMSLEEVRLHCFTIVNEVFSKKRRSGSRGNFKASKLETAVKRMLKSCKAGADARMMDTDVLDRKGCKVMVCVAPGERVMAVGVPVCLRTYTVHRNSVPDCTIVEAVRATFALPGMFKPAIITKSGGIKISYVGLGDMNPTTQLLDEVAHVFSGGYMASVLIIGAGQKKIAAMDSERTANEMAVRFVNKPGIYFRFNVEQGMQDIGLADWKNLSKGIIHAREYLKLFQNDKEIGDLAQALGAKGKTALVAHLNGTTPITLTISHRLKKCPPPSPLFVGQETQLGRMKRCLVDGSEERHVRVLHGLGGAGKTQLALKFVVLRVYV